MDIFSILFLMSTIHGIFLAVIIIAHSKRQINENIFLLLLLLIVSGYQFREFLILQGYFTTFPHLMAVFVPVLYLLGPIYFFYVKFAINQEVKFHNKDFLHIIPAFICFIIILPFYIKSGDEKLALYSAPQAENFKLASNRALFYGFMLSSGFLYCLKSLTLINSVYKHFDGRKLKSIKSKLKWLKHYTWSFLFFLLCFLIAQLIFLFTDFYQYYVMLGTVLASSILIHFISYWALKESRITSEEKRKPSSTLSKSKANDLKNKINMLLEKEKIYVNGNLSAKDFCDQFSINSKYLSQLINSEYNCNLTYLVNSYRIEEAKKILINKEYSHLNFLGIALKVGFNTKNTFTRAFKRHTGKTPSQFKVDETNNSISLDHN